MGNFEAGLGDDERESNERTTAMGTLEAVLRRLYHLRNVKGAIQTSERRIFQKSRQTRGLSTVLT